MFRNKVIFWPAIQPRIKRSTPGPIGGGEQDNPGTSRANNRLLAAALIGDLIFLPALLAGPLGRFFCPRKAAQKQSEMPPVDAQPSEAQPAGTTNAPGQTTGATLHSSLKTKDGPTIAVRADKPHTQSEE